MENKKKIINDPVHGFIPIPNSLIYDLIQHPYFQRLSRIKQLGMSYMVYPGAVHTRFLHSLGAMHLMDESISQLRSKDIEITEEESDAVLIAILLHDIGHAPFSHVLENTLSQKISHEEISLLMMENINKEYGGKLDTAIQIFQNKYHKKFLHQLVSSQLDMDRMDYLTRDSFFTGVVEGAVGVARIIKMLNVYNDQLVVEAKGIYSIEKFLIARRMMYWQVYLHKTAVSSEQLLIQILDRAKTLTRSGYKIFSLPHLSYFLEKDISKEDFENDPEALKNYVLFDDSDIMSAVKIWSGSEDKTLALLCKNLMNRRLPQMEVRAQKPSQEEVTEIVEKIAKRLSITNQEAENMVSIRSVSAYTYQPQSDSITILYGNGETKDIIEASDILNLTLLNKHEEKFYFSYIRERDLGKN